jgi:hypothetical protein
MTTHRDVTVLIPIHPKKVNREWLAQTLASFPDDTPRLILENKGDVGKALQQGLKKAETEWVMPFGADDVAGPELLDQLLGPAWNADVVYPSAWLIDEQLEETIGIWPAAPFCPLRLQHVNYVPGAALIRRQAALDAGGFRSHPVLEDWDLWLRMQRHGARFRPWPDAYFLYRQHSESRNERLDQDEKLHDRMRERLVLKPEDGDPLERAVATFYNAATPATTYLRCQLPARELPAVVNPATTIQLREEGGYDLPEQHGQSAVFQLAADKERALMLLMLREKGIRVLVEADDNYLANPGVAILKRSQWGMKVGHADNTRDGHLWIVEQADGMIVSTPYLADRYRKPQPERLRLPQQRRPRRLARPRRSATTTCSGSAGSRRSHTATTSRSSRARSNGPAGSPASRST